ncbi:interferon regulatory factor 2-like isoform X4 [Argonauta hians]
MSAYRKRRPLMKVRMRDWLTSLLDEESIPGLNWIDKNKKIFRIPWKHGSRQTWKVDDAILFVRWAEHGGKYSKDSGNPNTKRYKATFRCALNSLPDCEELKNESKKTGLNAFKVYQFKDARKNKCKKHSLRSDEEDEEEESLKNYSETSETSLPITASPSSSDEEIHHLNDQQSGGMYYQIQDYQFKTEDGTALELFNSMMGLQEVEVKPNISLESTDIASYTILH